MFFSLRLVPVRPLPDRQGQERLLMAHHAQCTTFVGEISFSPLVFEGLMKAGKGRELGPEKEAAHKLT